MLKFLALLVTAASAQTSVSNYLPQASAVAALQRSQQQCQLLGCDGGLGTASASGTVLTVTAVQGRGMYCGQSVYNAQGQLVGNIADTVANCAALHAAIPNGAVTGNYNLDRAAVMSSQSFAYGFTVAWWPWQTMTDGSVALAIEQSGPFGPTSTIGGACAVGCGLSAAEIAALQSSGQMGTKLPWIISEPAFMARFSPIQISAANSSNDQAIKQQWTAIKAAATVDLTNAGVVSMVQAMVADGIVTAANADTILAPVAVNTQAVP